MDQIKTDWLTKLDGKALAFKRRAEQLERKDAVLSQLTKSIQVQSTQIYDDMNLKVRDGEGNEQQVLNYLLRDQTTEFDLDEQQDGYTLTSDEDTSRHAKANRLLTDMSRMLDEEVDELDEDGNPTGKKVKLFSDDEVSEELYQPLVRQGLLPETMVPDKFSQTKKMIEGSFSAYGERLKKEGVKHKIFNQDNLQTGLACLSMLSNTVGSVGGFIDTSTVDPNQLKSLKPTLETFQKIGQKEVTESIQLSTQCWDLAMTGVEAVGDIHEALSEDEQSPQKGARAKAAPRVAQFLIAGVAAEFGLAFKGLDDKLSVALGGAYAASVGATKLAVSLAQPEPQEDDVSTALGVLAGGFKSSLKDCDPGGPSTDEFKKAGETISREFVSGVKLDTALTALHSQKYDALIAQVSQATKQACAEALKVVAFADCVKTNATEIAVKCDKKVADEFLDAQQQADLQSEKELAEIQDPKNSEAQCGKLLANRIATLERDQQLLKWSTALVGQGLAIASKFIAPLAIAGAALKLALNITQAVKRTSDFCKFFNSQREMFNSASPFSAPVANFIYNADIQAIHYTACAALELVNLIGAIVETAGTASGPGAVAGVVVGKALQATASTGAAIETALYEIKKRYDVEQGWKFYRTALARPENRKLALQAMQKNPTLAKYSMAWGAVIKKDPLVSNFMAKCGLDAVTLEDAGAKLDLVVKYLETRLPDDSVLVGRKGLATDWEPATIELTPACWSATKRRAIEKANLVDEDTRAIELALANYHSSANTLFENYQPDTKPAKLPAKEAVEACRKLLRAAEQALAAYRNPRRQAGQNETVLHEQMVQVLGRFADQASAEGSRLAKVLKVVNGGVDQVRSDATQVFKKKGLSLTADTLPVDLCLEVVAQDSLEPAKAFLCDPATGFGVQDIADQIKTQLAVEVPKPAVLPDILDADEILALMCGQPPTYLTAEFIKQRLGIEV